MYALIYDDRNLGQSEKKVISVHKTREKSEEALAQRQKNMGKRVYECNTRVVWTDKDVAPGDAIGVKDFSTWRPGEDIPVGELNSDAD